MENFSMKRFIASMLMIVMLIGTLPATIFAGWETGARATTPVLVDAAIFFSDLHVHEEDLKGSSTDKTSVINGVFGSMKAAGLPYSTVNSCGDVFSVNYDSGNSGFNKFTGLTGTVSGWIRNALGNDTIPVNYTWSDHDRYAVQEDGTTALSKDSGFVYGAGADEIYGTDDDANYYVYILSMADLGTNDRYSAGFHSNTVVTETINAFKASATALKPDRPILIASHMPLYDNRNDNGHAYEWAVAINEVAETKDVVYFHGHNHKYDAADGSEYYFAKGSTMSVCSSSSGSATDVKLNFTHINTGYLEPKSSNSYSSSTTRMNVAISVEIYNQYIGFVTYGTDGQYTGSFALDEKVERINVPGGTEEEETPSVPGTSVTDNIYGVTVSASNITALNVDKVTVQLDEKYHTSVSYDIRPEGYTQGTVAAVTIPVDTTVFDVTKPVCVLYEGEIIAITNIAEGKVVFTSDHFSVYTVAQTDEEIELDESKWVTVTAPSGGTTTYAYTQATSIATDQEYVIVANNNAVALMDNNGNMVSQTVTISGTTMTSTTELTMWTFSGASSGTIYNGTRYLRYDSSRFSLSTSSTTFTITDNDSNFCIRSGNYSFYYDGSSWTRSGRNTAQYVRLFVRNESGDVTVGGSNGLYAQAVGGDSTLYAPAGSLSAGVIDTAKQFITVYTTTDTTGSSVSLIPDDDSKLNWTATQDTSDLSKWTVTVSYDGKTLKEVDVEVQQKTISKVELSSNIGTAERGSTETDTKLIITYEDGTTAEMPVTTGMITAGSYNIGKNGTYTGLTVSYAGYDFTDYTLKVVNITGVNDYPAYPTPGSVKLDKTATGLDFQNTGLAQVQLSASGLPAEKGVDVVVVIDTSSSMRYNAAGSQVGYDNVNSRYYIMKESLEQMLIQFQTPNATTGVVPDIDIALIDFNGFRSTLGNAASLDGTSRTTTDNAKVYYNNANGTATSTLIKNISGGLTADYFMENTSINAASIKALFTGGNSGTNYDGAFQNAYDLLAAKQAANAAAGETREQYVIFMSDGASFRYNGFMTGDSGNRTRFDQWLDGIWEDQAALDAYIKANNYHSAALDYTYLYNGDGNVHLHRMAEAIKGDPNRTYEVVLDSTEKDADGDYLFSRKGLGAKIYSIGFCMQDDTVNGTTVKEATLREVIKYLSSGEGYYVENVTTKDALVDTFKKIASEIALAASNSRFVDQMGSAFELQMNPVQWSNNSKDDTVKNSTDITITTRPIYTQQDVDNGLCDTDDIGKPYGDGTTLESVSFIFGSNATPDDKIPSSVTSTAKSGNILIDGVICAQYFFYNTTSTSKEITLADGSKYNLPAETFYWNIGSINEAQFTLTYTVYLTGALNKGGAPAADSYETNNFAILYYDNYVGNSVSQSVASPTIAWSAAKVSYAFYLVNSEGKPVYKDGSVAPNFYTSYKVTRPVVYQTVELNEAVKVIAGPVAENVLPDGYTLYAPDVQYEVAVASGKGDGKHYSSWKIEDGRNATYVTGFGTSTDYSNATHATTDSSAGDAYQPNYDYANTVVWFPVLWIPSTIPDAIVIDFGLSVDINALENDQFGTTGILTGFCTFAYAQSNLRAENDKAVTLATINTVHVENSIGVSSTYTGTYGDAKILNGKIRYTPDTMTIDSYEQFVYEVSYKNSQGVVEYYYGIVTVIPATTIYYEESFVDFYNAGNNTAIPDGLAAGTVANGIWGVVGASSGNAAQEEDRPGKDSLPIIDHDNLYGYDGINTSATQYSLGTAAKVTVDNNHNALNTAPHAKFTFTGTGFDLISLTDNTSGAIALRVLQDGREVSGTRTYINNYYGYKYENGEWIVDESSTDCIWQVPVVKIAGLTYGTYTVELYVEYEAVFDLTGDDSYTFVLDSIRIYDPADDGVRDSDTTIKDAYAADNETNPQYLQIKQAILSAANGDTLYSDGTSGSGVVFIDGIPATNKVSDYTNPGPNNEAYLAKGQSISFKLHSNATPLDVQLGIKLAYGSSANVQFTYTVNGKSESKIRTFTTATDMYYSIVSYLGLVADNQQSETGVAWTSGTITLTNVSTEDVVISLTNIKSTFKIQSVSNPVSGVSLANDSTSVTKFARSSAAAIIPTVPVSEEETEPVTISFLADAEVIDAARAVMNDLYAPKPEPEPEIFTPEKLEYTVISGLFGINTVRVITSKDVASLTVNGVEATKLNDSKIVKTMLKLLDKLFGGKHKANDYDIWTVTAKRADSYDIIAYNADGVASDAAAANSAINIGNNGVGNRFDREEIKKIMESLAEQNFDPKYFESYFNKRFDGKSEIVAETSEDVEYVIIDGKIVTRFITKTVIDIETGEEKVLRVWIVDAKGVKDDEKVDVNAYDEKGVGSESKKAEHKRHKDNKKDQEAPKPNANKPKDEPKPNVGPKEESKPNANGPKEPPKKNNDKTPGNKNPLAKPSKK